MAAAVTLCFHVDYRPVQGVFGLTSGTACEALLPARIAVHRGLRGGDIHRMLNRPLL